MYVHIYILSLWVLQQLPFLTKVNFYYSLFCSYLYKLSIALSNIDTYVYVLCMHIIQTLKYHYDQYACFFHGLYETEKRCVYVHMICKSTKEFCSWNKLCSSTLTLTRESNESTQSENMWCSKTSWKKIRQQFTER